MQHLYNQIKINNPKLFCCYCEVHLWGDNEITRDHVIPKSKGKNNGKVHFKKTLSCCRECNQEKKNMYLNEYLGYLNSQIGIQKFSSLIVKIDNVNKLLRLKHC